MPRKKELPKSISILGLDYEILETPNAPTWLDNTCIGGVCITKNVIWVQSTLSPNSKGETLLHEVIHTIIDKLKIPVLYQVDDATLEVIIRSLAMGLWTFLSNGKNNSPIPR